MKIDDLDYVSPTANISHSRECKGERIKREKEVPGGDHWFRLQGHQLVNIDQAAVSDPLRLPSVGLLPLDPLPRKVPYALDNSFPIHECAPVYLHWPVQALQAEEAESPRAPERGRHPDNCRAPSLLHRLRER
jgi:hypothetical protein